MALVKDTNSYITVSEADTYFSDRVNAASWSDDYSSGEKAQALVTATAILDEQHWVGSVADVDQHLSWPRNATISDMSRGVVTRIESQTPQAILDATAELALHLLDNDSVINPSGSVDSLALSGIVLSDIKSPGIIVGRTRSLISKYLVRGGARSVFVGG